jgi:valyl-tRNA synthetase
VWNWKEQRGGDILQQTERLGASVDWTRTVFTLDDKVRPGTYDSGISTWPEHRDALPLNPQI